jgi:signal transduction protein with GAF and PtsI domain
MTDNELIINFQKAAQSYATSQAKEDRESFEYYSNLIDQRSIEKTYEFAIEDGKGDV